MASFYPSVSSGSKGRGKAARAKRGPPIGSAPAPQPIVQESPQVAVGDEVVGTIANISKFGIFINIGTGKDALLPWSKCTLPEEELYVGLEIEKLQVDKVDEARARVTLSGPSKDTAAAWAGWTPGTVLWRGEPDDEEAEEGHEEEEQGEPQKSEAQADSWWQGSWSAAHGWDSSWRGGWHGDEWSSSAWGEQSWQATNEAWASRDLQTPPEADSRTASSPTDARVPGAASAPSGNVQPAAQTREEVKRLVFKLLDRDKDGYLQKSELRPFVEQTGFEGGDSEWFEEYRLLCKDLKCDPDLGISINHFCQLLDDQTDSGCYCDDDELQELLLAFQRLQPQVPLNDTTAELGERATSSKTTASGNFKAAGAPPPRPEPSSNSMDTREEMKRAIFERLDVDRDGHLGQRELRPFVEKTGFDGTDDDWDQEYKLLCEDWHCQPKMGLSFKAFDMLLDDETDSGCYVPDEELSALTQSWDWVPAAAPDKGTATVATAKKQSPATVEPEQNDPWGGNWDPWSAPSAQRKHKQQMAAEERRKEDGAAKWREFQENAAKPALNAQKLLEALRAANAARKARDSEAPPEPRQPDLPSVPPPAHVLAQRQDVSGHASDHNSDLEEAAPEEDHPPANAAEMDGRVFGTTARAQATRAVSAAETLALMGDSVVRVSLGDSAAVQDLVDAVLGAPSIAHALALATSAIRSLLQEKNLDAQLLLQVEEINVDFVDGVAALLSALGHLARKLGAVASPLLQRTLVAALTKVDDKQKSVQAAALAATEEIVRNCDVYAFECLAPALLAALDPKRSPNMKLHALRLLEVCWRGDGERCVAHRLPVVLPAAINLLLDVNNDVKFVAREAVGTLCGFSGNNDLKPHHETVIGCARATKDVAKCVREMAEVVFVQEVEAPALAVMMPVITRGLKSRATRTQRQATVICENMCKLLPSVADVQHFRPELLPLLQRIREDASDPEVREVAARAEASLAHVADEDVTGTVRLDLRTAIAVSVSCAESATESLSPGEVFTPCPAPVRDVIMDFVVMLCVGMARCGVSKQAAWRSRLLPHLLPLVGHQYVDDLILELHSIAQRLETKEARQRAREQQSLNGEEEDEVAPGGVLCDCTMMLARGAATLLSGARLRLLRGSIYGLVGGNDSGKSCLLRAIHDRKVVGFPSTQELTSGLVEHGVGERPPESEMTPPQYLAADELIRAKKFADERIKEALQELGFAEGGRMKMPIRTLSGGWRMKLGLARAMLQEADLLLLDEPTGHLDASNLMWLVEYLQKLRDDRHQGVTVVTVSHDTSFLDKVCTHIIHVQNQTMQTYKGNFSHFIDRVPDAQLGTSALQEQLEAFKLPEPGPLDGVKSAGRRFFHLDSATYTYPGGNMAAVKNATAELSLRSRVAIVGPNGAGKSTLAGLIVGELAADSGVCWRHPNLRVAYVAQHAFHHLEKHVDMSATEYILWRFQGNEDREALEARAEEAETEEVRKYRFDSDHGLVPCDDEDPRAVEPEVALDRRQRGRLGYEYEVRWREGSGGGHTVTSWVSRGQLARMGYLGMAKREDERQAAQRSLSLRPLTTPSVEAHLAGFGLSSEEATHRRIGRLSNGQMARTVLAASTWLAPHLLVLDEPTNYLDGPALTALGAGLSKFGGGVVVISHNPILLNEVCTERWIMCKGDLQHEKGVARPTATAADEAEEKGGAPMSNKLLEAKNLKRQRRIKDLRRRKGEEVSDDEEDWWSNLLQKANAKDPSQR